MDQMESSVNDDFTLLLEQLQSVDKFICRKALIDLQTKVTGRAVSDGHLNHLFQSLLQVTKNNNVDMLREKSCTILLDLVSTSGRDDGKHEELLNLVSGRLPVEHSEEIRLLLTRILHSSLSNMWTEENMLKHLDLLTTTTKTILKDRYGEVVKIGCEVVQTLSQVNPHFRLQADYFIKPLLSSFNSHPMKVRIMCVKALLPILVHSSLSVPDIIPVLEKNWSEMSPPLHLVTVKTVGNAAIEFDITEQYLHLLMPILFLGICNDFPEISTEATLLWKQLKTKLMTKKAGKYHSVD